MTNVVRSTAEWSSKLVDRYLPDAFLFAILLTVVAYAWAYGALVTTTATGGLSLAIGLLQDGWYGGFWGLLTFAMQMTLILMTGYALAQAPAVDRLLSWIAGLPSSEKGAAAMVPVVAALASFVHWGLGLVVGAIMARKIAEEIRGIDFPVVVAGAYSGFVVWHGGLAGSIPLLLNTTGNFLIERGILQSTVPTGQTIFTVANLVLVAVVGLLFLPAVYALMYPEDDAKKDPIDPEKLEDEGTDAESDGENSDLEDAVTGDATAAERVEHSRLVAWSIGLAGILSVLLYFGLDLVGETTTMPWNNLNLNIVNFTFLFLGLVLHGTPRAYISAMQDAVENVWGIILQFPFYAGIMGIMSYAPEGGTSLATQIAQTLVAVAPPGTLPAISFLIAGFVNVFVPSGGGEWAVIGATLVKAAERTGTSVARVAMAAAWGDAWTNMIQPFWAIPLLAISGLSVRDIMGYCVVVLIGVGVIVAVGISVLPM